MYLLAVFRAKSQTGSSSTSHGYQNTFQLNTSFYTVASKSVQFGYTFDRLTTRKSSAYII